MAASFATLPFRLIPPSVASRPRQQQQHLLTVSSSVSISTNSACLPAAFFVVGSSTSPAIRSKLLAPNATPDEAAPEASVETLENETEAKATAAAEADAADEQEEAEVEAKPRGPPIVKLGDIMGVLLFFSFIN